MSESHDCNQCGQAYVVDYEDVNHSHGLCWPCASGELEVVISDRNGLMKVNERLRTRITELEADVSAWKQVATDAAASHLEEHERVDRLQARIDRALELLDGLVEHSRTFAAWDTTASLSANQVLTIRAALTGEDNR